MRNFGPSMISPDARVSKTAVTAFFITLADGPAAAGADHFATLVEEDVVVDGSPTPPAIIVAG
jgi:hypothetical protein